MTGTDPCQTLQTITGIESGDGKPFLACRQLADKIADLLEAADDRAAGCLQYIAQAFESTTNERLRLAIENGFLFQLGNRIFRGKDHRRLLARLPKTLHDALMHQMVNTGP